MGFLLQCIKETMMYWMGFKRQGFCGEHFLRSFSLLTAFPTCEALSQFSCANGRCISMKWHCDSGECIQK